jgi:uncharacterized membrane protein
MSLLEWVVLATAVLAGVAGGVFFAFSTYVMPALRRLAPAQAVAAMQTINVAAVAPFTTVQGAPAVLSVALIVDALVDWRGQASAFVVAGGVVYLVGLIGLTAVYHVPRNNALDRVDAAGTGAEAAWRRYAGPWTRWNHVRGVAGVLAAALFCIGLRALSVPL